MDPNQSSGSLSQAVFASLKEPAMLTGTAAAAGLFMSMAFLPILGVFVGSFTPAPIIYHYVRRGPVFGLTMAGLGLVTVFLIYAAFGRTMGALVFAEYTVMAAVMGQCLYWRFGAGVGIAAATASVVAMGAAVVMIGSFSLGQNPWNFLRVRVQQQLAQTMTLYAPPDTRTDAGRSAETPTQQPGEDLIELTAEEREFQQRLDRLSGALLRLFPGMMVIGAALVAWANFLLVRVLLARTGIHPEEWTSLRKWRSPEQLVWLLILAGFSVFLPLGGFKTLGQNVLLVLGLVYFFQGMAILAYWLNAKGAPAFVRVFLYTIIALQIYLAIMIAVVGLFDLWFDFRKLKTAPSGE
jgi:uncharacterized protein YybS (DUF2232 family)